jgi:hypothetical protein
MRRKPRLNKPSAWPERGGGKGVVRQKILLLHQAPQQAKPRDTTDTSCSRRAPHTHTPAG